MIIQFQIKLQYSIQSNQLLDKPHRYLDLATKSEPSVTKVQPTTNFKKNKLKKETTSQSARQLIKSNSLSSRNLKISTKFS